MEDAGYDRGGDRYGVFRVTELGASRWQDARGLLADGRPIAFDDVGFQLRGRERLTISPRWRWIRDPTVDDALRASGVRRRVWRMFGSATKPAGA